MKERISSQEIREIFLKFFEERGHVRITGASLLPANDPTLLFVNSGMAPLKRYFTGEAEPPHPDLCNVQPCIRTRDIEDVGDRHHLTFFEMMGSWSINNYFKERAIELAVELLVGKFGIPKEKLYATVYKGDADLNLPPDEVSARVWESLGLKPRQIVFLGEDNFWGPAGDSGPCGPCTEVFYDTGDEYGDEYQPGGHFDTKRRYIEIWNAGVFMELNKKPDGTFTRLRFNSVDTGSGVERMTMSMNRLDSVYDTDLMLPIITAVRQQLAGREASETDHRILTDHLRTSTYILSEGVVPSNEGRGYIPRRLIRKAIAIVTRADAPGFDFKGVINEVIERSAVNYPHLAANRDRILEVFERERRDFERVIGKGLERLDHLCKEPPFTVSGADAFALSSSYGLPVELIRDFVADKGGLLDEEEFAGEFRKHQEISRAAGSTEAAFQKAGKWPKPDDRFDALASAGAPTEFLGYEQTEAEGRVVALFRDGARVEEASAGQYAEVVFDRTPFYAEGGGQVGDQGVAEADGARFEVEDCIKVGDGYHVHRGSVAEGELRVGQVARLGVDVERRERIKRNHSATHLLHSALRTVLGEHVRQSGSLVEASRFRFDFQHPSKLSPEELLDIERLVNRYVRENIRKETVSTTYDDALRQGALAFFGDNYGSTVRLVRFGSASAELCGGTHVESTGDIGLFRIISEGSVASGVRRIVATTAESALEYTLQREQTLRGVLSRLKVGPDDVLERLEKLLSRTAPPAAGENGDRTRVDIGQQARTLPNGVRYVVAQLEAGASQLREEALRVAEELKGVTCLIGKENGAVRIVVAVEPQLTNTFDAGSLLRELVPYINGKGGGKKELAQGGGDKVSGVADVEREFPAVLERRAAGAA
ncbi:MAG TPA: alanine--tRNA ligase [Pyrinomonadaceae bacterium]|nr:alanine--tRNA ligase [Pyrinomonadaceae bacterium]